MLIELVVEGLGVIERAELDLDRGCSALTGETGAGKTLLVAALGLLLGGRGDRSLVRPGAEEARVEARFNLPPSHPAIERLEGDEETGPEDFAELVLARTVTADGRSKARVNGRLAPVATLAEVGPLLVEIAGQNEHLRVASPQVQRELLDAYAGEACKRLAAEVAERVTLAGRAAREIDALEAGERARSGEMESLRAELAEIEAADPREGETELLRAEAVRLEHAEEIGLAADRALQALRGEQGVEELLDGAARALERVGDLDPSLKGLAERLDAARLEVDDVAGDLSGRVPEVDANALEAVRARLAVLARLARRYGADESGLLARAAAARERLEEIESPGTAKERWARAYEEHRRAALELATRLSSLRAEAAERLEHEITVTLRELALPHAVFKVALEPCSLFEGGLESVSFLVAANPGDPARGLHKAASGGELARIALALHLVTAARGPGTLVFDEVDAGVGGEAAQAVGRFLAELASRTGSQVLVVTHLPQVAAFADAHYKVTKTSAQTGASASVQRIAGEERLTELSRMLAGLPHSERAKSHAQELLELAAST